MLSTRPAEERATMLQALDLSTNFLQFPSSLGFPRAPPTLLNLQNVCSNTCHKNCNTIQKVATYFQKICNPFQGICNKIQKVATHFRRFASTIQKVARIGKKNTKQNKTNLNWIVAEAKTIQLTLQRGNSKIAAHFTKVCRKETKHKKTNKLHSE